MSKPDTEGPENLKAGPLQPGEWSFIVQPMKKMLLGLFALTAVSTASAANYIGGSVGSGLTLHYQTDTSATTANRFSLNLDASNFNFNNLALGGSYDYLANFPGTTLGGGLTPYYGAGLGAGIYLGDATGVALYPHGTIGLKYNLTGPLSVFGEANAGPVVTFGNGNTGVGFGSGLRVGVNYMLGQ